LNEAALVQRKVGDEKDEEAHPKSLSGTARPDNPKHDTTEQTGGG
jgi:hypothetical protein